MRRLFLAALAFVGSVLGAQTVTTTSTSEITDLGTTQALTYEVGNDTVTGTTVNMLAKLVASKAVITATTDQFGILGIVAAGAGITGNAQIAIGGTASCVFDGATVTGHFVIQSTTVNGNCHDTGSTNPPTVGAIIGIVQTTNGAGGTFAVSVWGPGVEGAPRTGTSGGVLAYLGPSSIGSSVALTANVLVKGGGAGVAPGNSSITDNGTTISTAEPFSLADGSSSAQSIFFTSQGQGSGKPGMWRANASAVATTGMQVQDGSCTAPGYAWTNTATLGFDRNSATAINVCANGQIGQLGSTLGWGPTNQFQVTSAGAISTTATTNQLLLGSTTLNAPATTAATTNVAVSGMLTSTYTNATTTASNITGLSFRVEANTNYTMNCALYFQGSASTAGLDITITGPSAPTSIFYSYVEDITATTLADSVASAFATKLVGGTVTATTNLPATVTMGLRNGANAGTVQVQGSATGAGTVTVQAGSFCTLI